MKLRKIFKKDSFLEGISQYDGQWYLKIVGEGYGRHEIGTQDEYASFPIYPLLIKSMTMLGFEMYSSAFLVTQILQTCAFISLYCVVKERFGEKIAERTPLLAFIFDDLERVD